MHLFHFCVITGNYKQVIIFKNLKSSDTCDFIHYFIEKLIPGVIFGKTHPKDKKQFKRCISIPLSTIQSFVDSKGFNGYYMY